jgi:YHS domain-containing protein
MNTRFALLLLASSAVFAGNALVNPVNANSQGIAIKGFDTVAYFTHAQPVKGDPKFAYRWMGATWLFASSENRDAFEKEPDRYAPQFGGYCAWAVSNNYTASIDPEAWRVVDGKLYLNYSKDVQKKWQQDIPKRIEDANRNWPGLHR